MKPLKNSCDRIEKYLPAGRTGFLPAKGFV